MITKDTPQELFKVQFPDSNEGVVLNKNLAIKQGITLDTLELLKQVHIRKWGLLLELTACTKPKEMQVIAKQITDVEFELQGLWGFPKNAQFHRFWELPHCKCPKLDNEDRYGTPYFIYSEQCPIHSINKE